MISSLYRFDLCCKYNFWKNCPDTGTSTHTFRHRPTTTDHSNVGTPGNTGVLPTLIDTSNKELSYCQFPVKDIKLLGTMAVYVKRPLEQERSNGLSTQQPGQESNTAIPFQLHRAETRLYWNALPLSYPGYGPP